MITSPARPLTLAAVLATREADVREAWRVAGHVRAARRAGDAPLAAWYLKMLRTRVTMVRLSNSLVDYTATMLHLCNCVPNRRCVCAPPF